MEQQGVDDALGAQNDDPGEGTDQEIDPERDHDNDDARLLPPFGQQHGNRIRYGIAQGKGHCRRQKGRQDGRGENGQVERLKEPQIVVQGPLEHNLTVGGTGGEGNRHDDEQGQGKKERQPAHGRQDQQLAPFHFVTFTASAACQLMPTRSSAFHRFVSS